MKRILIVVLLLLFITSIPTYAINGPIEIKSPNIYGEFLWTKEYVDNITAEGIIDYSDILLPRRQIWRKARRPMCRIIVWKWMKSSI